MIEWDNWNLQLVLHQNRKTLRRKAKISREATFLATAIYLEESDDGQVKLSELVRSRNATLPIK